MPPILDPLVAGIFVREVFSTSERVNKVSVSLQGGLVSCCLEEMEVRVWDPKTLDLYGVLYTYGSSTD